jgi:DNA-binding transcriptional regulator YiaG
VAKRRPAWDADGVRALRRHLGLTQEELAQRMGTRQQTISEWETGMYAPRGVSERMLGMVAEQAGFAYGEEPEQGTGNREQGTGQGKGPS